MASMKAVRGVRRRPGRPPRSPRHAPGVEASSGPSTPAPGHPPPWPGARRGRSMWSCSRSSCRRPRRSRSCGQPIDGVCSSHRFWRPVTLRLDNPEFDALSHATRPGAPFTPRWWKRLVAVLAQAGLAIVSNFGPSAASKCPGVRDRGRSSVGRASASQVEGRGFKTRRPLCQEGAGSAEGSRD